MTSTARPQLLDALRAEYEAGRLSSFAPRSDDGQVVVGVMNGPTRSFDPTDMWAWLEGFQAGYQHPGTKHHTDPQALAGLRRVLINPSPADRSRVAILAAMEAAELDYDALAGKVGRSRAGVYRALRFDNTIGLTTELAHEALVALKAPTTVLLGVSKGPRAHVGRIAMPADVGPEPRGLTIARIVAAYADAGLLEPRSLLDPDAVLAPKYHKVRRGGTDYTLRVERALPWLQGLGDFAARDLSAKVYPSVR